LLILQNVVYSTPRKSGRLAPPDPARPTPQQQQQQQQQQSTDLRKAEIFINNRAHELQQPADESGRESWCGMELYRQVSGL
jgi:hypothetical protein